MLKTLQMKADVRVDGSRPELPTSHAFLHGEDPELVKANSSEQDLLYNLLILLHLYLNPEWMRERQSSRLNGLSHSMDDTQPCLLIQHSTAGHMYQVK
ncbi:hypothetical protein SRHO_G00201000 [Serrasalmus rhombeus]